MCTRLFPSYLYSTDPVGNLVRTSNTSFLTPLLLTCSVGFGYNFGGFGSFSLGISAAKFTWVRNKAVYNQQHIEKFYGVPRGKSYVYEYGLSVHLRVDKDLLKRVHWNCDLLIFKNYQMPADMILKNLIGIRISKFLKVSIQTRLFYETEVSKSIQSENMLSMGFYYNLLFVK